MKIIFLTFLCIISLFGTVDLNVQKTKIHDLKDNQATINLNNLKIGQSGIIIKNIDNNIIISKHAVVSDSNNTHSTITFTNNTLLPQDAIPTSALNPSENDEFILNHLYNTSLLIVPNTKAKNIVTDFYPNQNFLNEDFFAAHLKLLQTPIPTKNTFIKFAQKQQIGTLFIVIENELFVLDALSFTVIDTIKIDNSDTTQTVPFLTKITEIKTSFWDFGDEKITNYTKYYKKLLEIE